MATLEKIRNRAALLVIVVGIALLAFIIGDFLRSSSTLSRQKQENILTVNSKTISYFDFQSSVEERINALKQNDNCSFSDDEQNQIRQMILNESIDDILFAEETKKLGLTVCKDEFKNLVMGNNISPIIKQYFQNSETGNFDKSFLLSFLQYLESDSYKNYSEQEMAQLMEQKKAWLMMEEQIIKEQLRKKFDILISFAVLVNDAEAKIMYESNKTSVDFDYVMQSCDIIPDGDVSVSNTEIQKLYNERKNQYKQEEVKVLTYIAYPIDPSPVDYQNIKIKLTSLKAQLAASENTAELVQNNSDVPCMNVYSAYSSLDENVKQFVNTSPVGAIKGPILTNKTYCLYKIEGKKTAPDSVKLNAIMLPMTLDELKTKHLADSLIQVMKNGISFTDIALNITNGQTKGELGWVTEVQLLLQIDARFKDAVFDATVAINEPFVAKSNVGTFLVQITGRTPPVRKYKISTIQIHVMPSQETKTRLYNKLNQFISTHHSIEAWKKNANKEGFNLQSGVEIGREQINIAGIGSTRQVIRWAFNNEKGAISDIYECQDGEYFLIAIIEDHVQKGFRPLASVSNLLKRELINRKKCEKLVSSLKEKKITSLEQYAEAMNTTPQSIKSVFFATQSIPGIGFEPILNVEMFIAPVNQISGPYVGKNNVYVIRVTAKRESKKLYDANVQKRQMQIQNMYRTCQQLKSFELLRENAKIRNNFSYFF